MTEETSERSINAQGPRNAVTEELVSRAWRDPAFKAELLKDPRGVIERELGVQLPEAITVYVHEETPEALHLVLPLPPAALTRAVAGSGELADADVAGFADKNQGPPDPTMVTSSCSCCSSVGGVRG